MVNELIIGSLALARSSWVGVGMAMHRYYGSVFFFVCFFPAKYVKVALLGRGEREIILDMSGGCSYQEADVTSPILTGIKYNFLNAVIKGVLNAIILLD